jgi:bifunctional DNase/RNase
MLKKTIRFPAAALLCLFLLTAGCSTFSTGPGGEASADERQLTEVKVKQVMLDPESGVPVVLLQDLEESVTLPIWIGSNEAVAIAAPLERMSFQRPMTHDLLDIILKEIRVTVVKVVVTDLRQETFFADLYLKRGRKRYQVDCRPSDAIALAVRTGAPIFVSTEMLLKAGIKKGVKPS